MSPNTKKHVKWARGTQLGLRAVTLLGALASLFFSIVIKNAAVTIIWIMRAGVSVHHPRIHNAIANSKYIAYRCHSAYDLWHLSFLALPCQPPSCFASQLRNFRLDP